ncbi:MAG: N-6 DNA methylase, partial [Actinobacteria bacterium]|nr:N-6 DNA methylase [Actinomycetota bacterium]
MERIAGCAFDGNWIIYIRWERSQWRITRPIRVDDASLAVLVDTITSLATGRGLTAANLDQDFGRGSPSAALVVGILAAFFVEGRASGRGLSMFNQWAIDLGSASGPFSSGDESEWQQLCAELGVDEGESNSGYVLFALQTYFSLVAKLIALVILEGATGQPLVARLLDESEGSASDRFSALERGELTAVTGTINVIEPGIFSWYLGENDSELFEALSRMAEVAGEYSAEIVEITPLAARDILKDLYQRLVPRAIRHRLGEYYTPDWLAQRVLNQVTGAERALDSSTRILDPACGSGTFLVEIISRMIETAGESDPGVTLQKIAENVVGFD